MKLTPRTFFVISLLMTVLTGCQSAPRELEIQDAWARPGFSEGNTGVYLTIDNTNGSTDILLSGSTEIAEFTELHQTHIDHSGTMKMEPLQSIEVANNSRLSLSPGGLHVMLINLQQDLNPGETFELTLLLQQRGPITVTVEVREPN
jgi:periplasmic copper chaperone A